MPRSIQRGTGDSAWHWHLASVRCGISAHGRIVRAMRWPSDDQRARRAAADIARGCREGINACGDGSWHACDVSCVRVSVDPYRFFSYPHTAPLSCRPPKCSPARHPSRARRACRQRGTRRTHDSSIPRRTDARARKVRGSAQFTAVPGKQGSMPVNFRRLLRRGFSQQAFGPSPQHGAAGQSTRATGNQEGDLPRQRMRRRRKLPTSQRDHRNPKKHRPQAKSHGQHCTTARTNTMRTEGAPLYQGQAKRLVFGKRYTQP